MKTPAERGVIGAWAYEARAEADLSVGQVVDEMTRRGHSVTESTLRGIEGGSKKPSRRLLRSLAEVYGRPAPGERSADKAEDDSRAAIVAALDRQTEAILQNVAATQAMVKALGARMDRLEEDRQRDFAALVEAIGQQLAPVIVGSDAGASNGSPDPAPVSGPDRK